MKDLTLFFSLQGSRMKFLVALLLFSNSLISIASEKYDRSRSIYEKIKVFVPAELSGYQFPKEEDIYGPWKSKAWTKFYRKNDKLNDSYYPFVLAGYFNKDDLLDYVLLFVRPMDANRYAVVAFLSNGNNFSPYIIERDVTRGYSTEMGFYRIKKSTNYHIAGEFYKGDVDLLKYVYFNTAEMLIFYDENSDKFLKLQMSE